MHLALTEAKSVSQPKDEGRDHRRASKRALSGEACDRGGLGDEHRRSAAVGATTVAMSAEKGGGRRRAGPGKIPGERADEIKVVALRLFAERDFKRVTIKEIARHCDINTALIYYYFENKEDLFRAAIEHAIAQAIGRYQQVHHDDHNPVQRISDWFEINARLATSMGKLLKIMLDYSLSDLRFDSVDGLIREFYENERLILSQNIRKGMSLGLFRSVDAERVALFVSSHLDGVEFAAMIRRDLDRRAMISDLEAWLWAHLGYDHGSMAAGGRRSGAEDDAGG